MYWWRNSRGNIWSGYLSMTVTTMKYLMWLILWIPYWVIWNKQSTSCKLWTNSWNIKTHHVQFQVHLSQLNNKHYVHFWILQRLNYWVKRKYESWAGSSKNPRRHKGMPWVYLWPWKMGNTELMVKLQVFTYIHDQACGSQTVHTR